MGKFFAGLVVLVAVVIIGGFANYHRNEPLDNELKNRPYATLSDDDLNALIEAYQMESRGLQNRLEGFAQDRTGVMDGYAPSDLHGKLGAFDSFQRKNESWRTANRTRLSHEVELEKLEFEGGIRHQGLHIERNRIWRRLSTF